MPISVRRLPGEYLIERHGIAIGCIDAGLWKAKASKRSEVHQSRYRRACRGELIQVDGSIHDWFEDRGPRCTLLVYIDDATSELMHLEMLECGSAFAYMQATKVYIGRHGKPIALYSDKHGAFRNNRATADGGTRMSSRDGLAGRANRHGLAGVALQQGDVHP